jgi:hypothetical protein
VVRAVFDITIDVLEIAPIFDVCGCSWCMSTCSIGTSSNTFVTTTSQQFVVDWNALNHNWKIYVLFSLLAMGSAIIEGSLS